MNDQVETPLTGDELLTPPERGYSHFGKLVLHATPINFVKGDPGYSIEGITDREGLPYYFKGKQKTSSKRPQATHLVMSLEKTTKEGEAYIVWRQVLTSDKTYKKVVKPALYAVLKNPGSFVNTGAVNFVRVDEVGTGEYYDGTDDEGNAVERERRTFKVTENFTDPASMKIAEDAFFAEFAEAGGEAVVSDVPDGFTPDAWNAMKAAVESDLVTMTVEQVASKWKIDLGFIQRMKAG